MSESHVNGTETSHQLIERKRSEEWEGAKCRNNRLKCLLISIKIRFRIVSHVAAHMSQQVHPIVFHKSLQIEISFSNSYAQSNAEDNGKDKNRWNDSREFTKHFYYSLCACVLCFDFLIFSFAAGDRRDFMRSTVKLRSLYGQLGNRS